jgi:hypothetical protein
MLTGRKAIAERHSTLFRLENVVILLLVEPKQLGEDKLMWLPEP